MEPTLLAELIDRYGWLFAALLILIMNLDKVGRAAERVLGKVLPSFFEGRKLRLEAQRENLVYEREERERERIDTIMALKETLIATRDSLAEERRERRQMQGEMTGLVVRYERHDAAFVEAIRDVSGILREQHRTAQEQTQILFQIAAKVGIHNDAREK